MSIVNALSRLKTNIFGGPGNTGFSRPPPSKVQDISMTNTPVSSLDSDPLKFGTYHYPLDVFAGAILGITISYLMIKLLKKSGINLVKYHREA